MDSIIQYLKEVKSEIKEVVFPSTSQTTNYTIIVIVISIFVAIVLGGVDFLLREGLTKIIVR